MKTQSFRRNLYLLVALVFSLMLSACGKNSSSQQNQKFVDPLAIGQYVWNGAACVDRTTGIQVNSSLCAQSTSGYYLINGYCYSPNGQLADLTFCSAVNNGASGMQCHGYYLTPSSQYVLCNGANCSGAYLYSTTTGLLTQCL